MSSQTNTKVTSPANGFRPDTAFLERFEALAEQHSVDLDGTPGGGIAVRDDTEPQGSRVIATSRPRGYTTTKQWRNDRLSAPDLDLPPRTPEADAASQQVMSQLGRRMLSGTSHTNELPRFTHRKLVGSNGRAVLGSLGWSDERVAKYLQDNPGARIE